MTMPTISCEIRSSGCTNALPMIQHPKQNVTRRRMNVKTLSAVATPTHHHPRTINTATSTNAATTNQMIV